MRLPWDTRSDATLISAMVKTMGEPGWYLEQPRLGAPFGQHFSDFPHGGETFQLSAMKVLVTVTGDWGLAINLYFLLGFGVLAVVTFLVLRHLRFGPVVSGHRRADLHVHAVPLRPRRDAPVAQHLLLRAAGRAAAGLGRGWRERFLADPDRVGRRSHRGTLRWRRVAVRPPSPCVIAGTETMTTALHHGAAGVGRAGRGAPSAGASPAWLVAGVMVVMGGTFVVLSDPTLNYYRVARHQRRRRRAGSSPRASCTG